jgi:outer membrane receptor protein involved in Fe transport
MNQLPQFVQGQTQSTIGAVALAGPCVTEPSRSRRNTQSLVLLDGRRLPLSNANGVVDVNMIPQFILDGVETITGGASAVYGSDAMSGVVNFKSLKDFSGMQLDVRSGISDQGGAATLDIGITGGFEIAEGRGNVLLSASFTDRDVLWGNERDFYQLGVLSSFIGTGTFVPSPTNLPQQSVVNTVFGIYGVAAGSVLNSRSLGFNDTARCSARSALTLPGTHDGLFQHHGWYGSPAGDLPGVRGQSARAQIVLGKFDFDVTDSLTATANFSIRRRPLPDRSAGRRRSSWSDHAGDQSVHPGDLATVLASRPTPGADFTLNQRFMAFDYRAFPSISRWGSTSSASVAHLPFKDWRWDVLRIL